MRQPEEHVAELERELAELRAAAPAHSMPPSLLQRMEELEEALEATEAASAAKPEASDSQQA